ncbi:hypothetical protein H6F86_21140 [Phormidium sp. FACHB-592]|uniref:Uncharacterized protein n=1 Tax=Stenomitos frigidus AS-A4 TaxID=2933935 RepID=A0ABV0KET8_9CYAN|nr:hypothetical protein [Phormidium sp. FACHB-592]MBD2076341.1 hypothetical protein [Phormidium sp. FACHB-592]
MNHNKCDTLHHPTTVPINEGGTSIVVCSRCYLTLTPSDPMRLSPPPIPTLKPAPPLTGQTDRVILFNRRVLRDRLSPRISRHRTAPRQWLKLFPVDCA